MGHGCFTREYKLKPCPFCGFEKPHIVLEKRWNYLGWDETAIYASCAAKDIVSVNKNGELEYGCGASVGGMVVADSDLTPELMQTFMECAAEAWNMRASKSENSELDEGATENG